MPRTRQHGGAREGKQGTPYPNRSDLRSPKVVEFPSSQYGRGVQQAQAQAAVPITGQPAPAAPTPGAPPPYTGPPPGSLGSLTDPTALPDQPITAGAPFGPGPGPSPLPGPDDQAIDRLRILFQQTGLASLGAALEAYEDGL